MTPEEALDRVRPAGWHGEVTGVLHEGVTSRSFLIEGLVEEGGARCVLRIDEPLAGVLGLDRARERTVLAGMAAAGLAPPVLGWWPGPPAVLLRPWLAGAAWSTADFREPSRWPPLAALLRRVHATPVRNVPALDVAAVAARYALQGDAAANALARRVARRAGEVGSPRAVALCHGDPVAGNVVGDREPQLIDWEYAAPGDPLFDVAAVAVHHGLDEAQTSEWLGCYAAPAPPAAAALSQRLAAWREVYAGLGVLWLGVVARERGLDPAAAHLYLDLQSALDRAR